MIICPICKVGTGFYSWPSVIPGGPMQSLPYILYQREYAGEPNHISPRCSRCFDKAMGKKEVEQ